MTEISHNRSKIVCTIGPASESTEMLRKLIVAGMDVARLNFSHGTHKDHAETIHRVRKLNDELGTNISILMDLQGPKIRIGELAEPYPIKAGEELVLNASVQVRSGNVLPIQYETFASDVKAGDRVLIDDGKVSLNVIETNGKDIVRLEVVNGNQIGSKKGVNLPYTDISLPSLTEKDIADLKFALEQDADWIALSFVRRASEVRELKRLIKEKNAGARVIAKIEKPEALKNIDEIIMEADGIMVARGDMGVEIPLEDVPLWQKTIVRKCNRLAKPVIVATQMMESMIVDPRPTRAEASDVANAVYDGADAVMLSAETSVGAYPVRAVESMSRIIRSVEGLDDIYYKNLEADSESPTHLNDSLIITACKLARDMDAQALVGLTVSGYTAFLLSKCRPKSHIYIFTSSKKLLNIINLVWGVRAFYYDGSVGTDETIKELKEILKKERLLTRGDILINTASMPLEARGRTNMIKFEVVD